jgi:hypothetical protein
MLWPRGLFEQQGGAAGAQHAIGDLGHFQHGIHFHRDALELADGLKLANEIAQIGIFHGTSLTLRLAPRRRTATPQRRHRIHQPNHGRRLSSATMPAKTAAPNQLLWRKALKQPARSRSRISV